MARLDFLTSSALQVLALPGAISLVSWLGFLVGAPVDLWVLPFALGLAFSFGHWACQEKGDLRKDLFALLTAIVLLSTGSGLALLLIDITWDAGAYHVPAMMALADGWNPIATPNACDWLGERCADLRSNALLTQYPMASWLFGAVSYQLIGGVGAAHGFVIPMLLATGVITFGFTRRIAGPYMGTVLAIVLIANPVATTSLFSSMNDSWMACYLLLLLVSLLELVEDSSRQPRNRLVLATAALSTWVLINIKFTGLAYAGFTIAAFMSYFLFRSPRAAFRYSCFLFTIGILAVLTSGYHPYVHNFERQGNPLAKSVTLSRPNAAILNQAPSEFWELPRWKRFLVANTSVKNQKPVTSGDPWSRMPIPIDNLLLDPVPPPPDGRFTGFGSFYVPALVVAIALGGWLCPIRWWIALFSVALAILGTDAGWWSRLTPQAWWIPGLILLGIIDSQRSNVLRTLFGAPVLIAVLLTTGLGIAGIRLEKNSAETLRFFNALQVAVETKSMIHVFRERPGRPSHFQMFETRRLRDLGLEPSVRVTNERCPLRASNQVTVCSARAARDDLSFLDIIQIQIHGFGARKDGPEG